MSATWPSELQNLVNQDSFGLTFGDSTIRSDMDVGPAKVRRRITKAVDSITCSITLKTASEYSAFEYFYKTTLNGGVNQFAFNHPITGVQTDFRISKTPSFRPLGGSVFQVSMEWEIVS